MTRWPRVYQDRNASQDVTQTVAGLLRIEYYAHRLLQKNGYSIWDVTGRCRQRLQQLLR